MNSYDKQLYDVLTDYEDEYGTGELIEEILPGWTGAEIILALYNAGEIPTDQIEKFLNDE